MNRYDFQTKHGLPKTAYFRVGDKWNLNMDGVMWNARYPNNKYPMTITVAEATEEGIVRFDSVYGMVLKKEEVVHKYSPVRRD